MYNEDDTYYKGLLRGLHKAIYHLLLFEVIILIKTSNFIARGEWAYPRTGCFHLNMATISRDLKMCYRVSSRLSEWWFKDSELHSKKKLALEF